MQVVIVDVPFPPSNNAIWRGAGRHVYRSKKYMDWLKDAGQQWLIQKPKSKCKNIVGKYTLRIILNPPDKRLRDLGNYEKSLSDFAAHMGIIENDHLCRKITIEYGGDKFAPLGARMILHPISRERTFVNVKL